MFGVLDLQFKSLDSKFIPMIMQRGFQVVFLVDNIDLRMIMCTIHSEFVINKLILTQNLNYQTHP